MAEVGWAVVAAVGAIAVLGVPAIAMASPVTGSVVAHRSVAAVVPAAGPITRHTTARLCSTVQKAGQMTCFAIQQTDTVQPAGIRANAVSPLATPVGLGPTALAAAYKLDQAKGTGQMVAIVDAFDDPQAESDLAAYRTQFGLPSCTTANGCFAKVNQSGSTTSLPRPDAGWAGEISLDLDMVSATCPKCHILLVEATDNVSSNMGTAVNRAVTLGAKYVSNSYGGPENGSESSQDSAYYHHAGVAITASTGDSNTGAAYPATGKYVTAVGGTSLTSASNARGWAESAWNTAPSDGTGSGCSISEAKPSFQSGLTTGCSHRAEADVSAVADPNTGVAVFDTYQAQGWQVFGGTSASSPIIASVYALAGTPGSSDSPNTYPYARASNLFDVTSGNNGTCSAIVLCNAGPGWDGPTGLGTPNGTAAFTGANTVNVTNPGTQTSMTGSLQSLQIHASGTGSGSHLAYAASGMPSGLDIDSGTGLISGTSGTVGRYTVTVTVTDDTNVSGSTTFTWVTQAPLPPAIGVFSARDFTGDGGSDVLAVTTRGDLYLYRGSGRGGFTGPGTRIGTGWGGFTKVFSPGDFTGDGRSDVLAVTARGDLYLYRGSGRSGFTGSGTKIASAGATYL